MKCLEYIFKDIPSEQVKNYTDVLQFAYTSNHCVEDIILSIIDSVLHHLNTANNFVRILFIYFSSAFNTIHAETNQHECKCKPYFVDKRIYNE